MYNDFGNAVNEYFVKEFRRLYKERQKRIDALSTPEAVLEYAAQARKRIREVFDLERCERTPLNCRVTSEYDFQSYHIKIPKSIAFNNKNLESIQKHRKV